MIIRPKCKGHYVVLPNALLNDDLLSIDTRGMLAHLVSKPRNWQIRPKALARALSKKDAKLGNTKLRRMFKEAEAAGYMSRPCQQTHQKNGDFGSYDYVVGMPEDVSAAKAARSAGPEQAASSRPSAAHALSANAQNAPAQNVHTLIHKKQNPNITDYQKSHPQPLPDCFGADRLCEDGYTMFGKNEEAKGMKFAFEHSRPFNAWLSFRGADGMPPMDVRMIGGIPRRGSWFPSLYPPGFRRFR